jgi:hypothetical protein
LSREAEQTISEILAPECYISTRIENERNLIAVPEQRHADWNANYALWKQARMNKLTIRAKPVLTFTP